MIPGININNQQVQRLCRWWAVHSAHCTNNVQQCRYSHCTQRLKNQPLEVYWRKEADERRKQKIGLWDDDDSFESAVVRNNPGQGAPGGTRIIIINRTPSFRCLKHISSEVCLFGLSL